MKISVVINTYNSERALEQCLEGVKQFDEIVVCDMHSTDRTVAIAEKYNARIIYHEHTKIVEPAREFAIAAALNNWVLVVDSDEIVTPALREYLYRFTSQNATCKGLFIPRKNYFMGRFMHASYPNRLLRFFEKSSVSWPAIIHAVPTVSGSTEKIPRCRRDLALVHLECDDVSDVLRKMDTYSDKSLEKDKRRYGGWGMFGRSWFVFFRNYIIKGGFRDGLPGFIYCGLTAFTKFVTIAKSIQKRYNAKG